MLALCKLQRVLYKPQNNISGEKGQVTCRDQNERLLLKKRQPRKKVRNEIAVIGQNVIGSTRRHVSHNTNRLYAGLLHRLYHMLQQGFAVDNGEGTMRAAYHRLQFRFGLTTCQNNNRNHPSSMR